MTTSRYTRQDFDEEVCRFATETRKKTRKKVEKIGWNLMISHELTWLVVSILMPDGQVLTQNVLI